MALKVGELFASFGIDTSGLNGQLSSITKTCNSIGSGMMTAGAGITAAVTAPVVKFAKGMYEVGSTFDAQMSKVFAIRGLDKDIEADAEAMDALRKKALYMGSTTEWTASQAGEAFEYMGMAGWTTEAMLAGIEPVMHLATAAGSDLGTTSDIVTDAMTAFGYTLGSVGGDTEQFTGLVTHFTDVLAAAATNSNTNVELLGTSFKYVAPLAGALGYSVDDVAVALGLMANSGIKSTMAGAGLRNILTNMISPTEKSAAAMETLGISMYDSQGNVKDLRTVMSEMRSAAANSGVDIEELAAKTAELDAQFAAGEITEEQYLASIDELTAGSSEFLAACIGLAGKQGLSGLLAIMNASEEDWEQLTGAIDDCEGATDKMAATMLDNAWGSMQIMKSAFEGLEITLWDLTKDAFQGVVDKITEMITSFQNLDPELQKGILKFGGLAAISGPVLLLGGKIVKMLPAIAGGIAKLASPMGIAALGLALFAIAATDETNQIGKAFEKMSASGKKKLQEFNKTITSKMSEASDRIPALTESITKSVTTIVPEAMKSLTLISVGLMDALANNADSIADVGFSIITTLVDGIAESLPQLIPSAVKMIASLGTALVKNAPKLVNSILGLLDGAIDGVKGIDVTGLITEFLSALETSVSSISSSLSTWITNAVNDIKTGEIDLSSTATTIVTALTSALKTVITGASSLAVTIIDSIASLLSTEADGSNAFTSNFTSLGTIILNGIADVLPTLFDAAGNIVDSLANLLNNLDWEGAADSLTSIGSAIIDVIVKGITGAYGLAEKIVGAIATIISDEGAASQILEGAKTIATTLITKIGEAIPTIAGAAVSLLGSIGDLLSGDSSEEYFAKSKDVATSIISAIVAQIPNVAKAAVDIIGAIAGLFTKEGAIDSIADGALSIATSLIDAIIDAIPSLTTAAVDIIGSLGQLFTKDGAASNLATSATNIAVGLIDAIAKAIPSVFESAGSIVEAIGTAISNADLAGLLGNLTTLGSAIMNAIIKAIEGADKLAGTLVETIGNLLTSILEDENISLELSGFAKMLFDGIVKGIDGLSDAGVNIVNKLAEILKNIDWTKVGDNVGNFGKVLIDGIINGIGSVVNGASRLVTALCDLIADVDWEELAGTAVDLASTLVSGIIDGAKNLIPDVSELISAIARGIPKALGAIGKLAGSLVGELIKAITDPNLIVDLIELGGQLVAAIAKGMVELGDGILKGSWDFVFGAFKSLFKALGIIPDDEVQQVLDTGIEVINSKGEELEVTAEDILNHMNDTFANGELNAADLENYIKAYEIVLESGNRELFDMYKDFWWLHDESITDIMFFAIDESNDPTERAMAWIMLQELGLGEVMSGLTNAEELQSECRSILETYGDDWQSLFDAAAEAGIIDNTYLTDSNASEAIYDIWQMYGGTAEDFIEAINTYNKSIEAAMLNGGKPIGGTGKVYMDENRNLVSEVIPYESFEEAAMDMFGKGLDELSAGEKVLIGYFPDIELNPQNAEESGAEVGEEAANACIDAYEEAALATFGKSYVDLSDAEKVYIQTTPQVETAAEETTAAVEAGVSEVPEVMEEAAAAGCAGFVTELTNETPQVEAAALTLEDAAVKQFVLNMTGEQGASIANAFIGGIESAFTSAVETIKNASSTVATAAKKLASSILGPGNGHSVGSNFANGIASGIRSGRSAIINAAIEVAQAAAEAAKGELDIHSPSRVARDEIGVMFDEGIVNGLIDEQYAVANAARGVAESMHDSYMIGDPSRGTVYTSQQTARQNAEENARATENSNSFDAIADKVGDIIAERLIASGALNSNVYIDKTQVGYKTADTVSGAISKKAKVSILGRSLQGVLET